MFGPIEMKQEQELMETFNFSISSKWINGYMMMMMIRVLEPIIYKICTGNMDIVNSGLETNKKPVKMKLITNYKSIQTK